MPLLSSIAFVRLALIVFRPAATLAAPSALHSLHVRKRSPPFLRIPIFGSDCAATAGAAAAAAAAGSGRRWKRLCSSVAKHLEHIGFTTHAAQRKRLPSWRRVKATVLPFGCSDSAPGSAALHFLLECSLHWHMAQTRSHIPQNLRVLLAEGDAEPASRCLGHALESTLEPRLRHRQPVRLHTFSSTQALQRRSPPPEEERAPKVLDASWFIVHLPTLTARPAISQPQPEAHCVVAGDFAFFLFAYHFMDAL